MTEGYDIDDAHDMAWDHMKASWGILERMLDSEDRDAQRIYAREWVKKGYPGHTVVRSVSYRLEDEVTE